MSLINLDSLINIDSVVNVAMKEVVSAMDKDNSDIDSELAPGGLFEENLLKADRIKNPEIREREMKRLEKHKENLKSRKKELSDMNSGMKSSMSNQIKKDIKEAKVYVDAIDGSCDLAVKSAKEWIAMVPKIIACAASVTSLPAAVPMASTLKQNVSATNQALKEALTNFELLKKTLSMEINYIKTLETSLEVAHTTISNAQKAVEGLDSVLSTLPV